MGRTGYEGETYKQPSSLQRERIEDENVEKKGFGVKREHCCSLRGGTEQEKWS